MQVDVRADVAHIHQRQILVDSGDAGDAFGIFGAMEFDGRAVDEDLTGILAVDARKNLDQCGLAGSVVANQGHYFARIQLKVDVAQCLDMAKCFGDAPGLQNGLRYGCGGGLGRFLMDGNSHSGRFLLFTDRSGVSAGIAPGLHMANPGAICWRSELTSCDFAKPSF